MIGEFFLMKITLKLILNIAYHLGDKKQNYSKLPKTTLYSIFFYLNEDSYKKELYQRTVWKIIWKQIMCNPVYKHKRIISGFIKPPQMKFFPSLTAK